ncbi:MAG: PilZ domain-containing protein [Desulfobulbaceae bacterium]|nr:PilZ domain-containing protein [Desulfobulbaceae bacterium]
MNYKNETGYSEKRKYERLDKKFKISYCQQEDLSNHVPNLEGELLDIGGGGIRFLAGESIKKNSQLVIRLEFSGWKVDKDEWTATGNSKDHGLLKVIGNVMWSVESRTEPGKYEVGVSFSGRIL